MKEGNLGKANLPVLHIYNSQISEDEGFAGSLSRSASRDHLSPLDVSWEERVEEEDVWDLAIKAKPKTHYVWEQVGRYTLYMSCNKKAFQ